MYSVDGMSLSLPHLPCLTQGNTPALPAADPPDGVVADDGVLRVEEPEVPHHHLHLEAGATEKRGGKMLVVRGNSEEVRLGRRLPAIMSLWGGIELLSDPSKHA